MGANFHGHIASGGYSAPSGPGFPHGYGQQPMHGQHHFSSRVPPTPIPQTGYQLSASMPFYSRPNGAHPTAPQYGHNQAMQFVPQQPPPYYPPSQPMVQPHAQSQGQQFPSRPPHQGPVAPHPPYSTLQATQPPPAYQTSQRHAMNPVAYPTPNASSRMLSPQHGSQRPPHNLSPPSQSAPHNVLRHSPTTTSNGANAASSVDQASFGNAIIPEGHKTSRNSTPVPPESFHEFEEDFAWKLQNAFPELPHKPSVEIFLSLPTSPTVDTGVPPKGGAKGTVSKYVRPCNLEVFSRDVRLSLNWAFLKHDPVFKDFDLNATSYPLREVYAYFQVQARPRAWQTKLDGMPPKMRQRFEPSNHTSGGLPMVDHTATSSTTQAGSTADSALPPSGTMQPVVRSVTPIIDPAALSDRGGRTPTIEVDDDVWAPQPGEGVSAASPKQDPTEALLASLGVTGSPKPVFQNEHRLQHSGRQDSGYGSQTGSYIGQDDYAHYVDERQLFDADRVPPPPPGPPPSARGRPHYATDSPLSDHSDRHYPTISDDTQNGFQQGSSPLTPQSAGMAIQESPRANDRKRSATSSRQADDNALRYKRRQPVVAEAYRYCFSYAQCAVHR